MEESITESIVGQIRRIKVLHVDDDPQFATVVRQFLERQDDTLEVETVEGVGAAERVVGVCRIRLRVPGDHDGLDDLRCELGPGCPTRGS